MLKSIKILIILITLFMLSGCGEEEYQDYMDAIGDGATCVYYPYGENQFSRDLSNITFTADETGLSVIYKLTNGSSVTENYITIEYDSSGNFKSIKENENHNVGDYKFSFSNFTLQNFFNNFKNYGNKCQQYIYLYDNRSKYLFYETKYSQLSDNLMYTFSTESPSTNPDKDEGGSANSCENAQATDCKKYTVSTYLDGDVTIELGHANNMNYYMVYNGKSSGIDYNYNDTDSAGVKIGSYNFMVRANDWSNLFPTSTTYANELYIDEKSLACSIVAHITVVGSQTITDYEMFGTPQDAGISPSINKEEQSTTMPDLEIEEINFCEEKGVLKTFQIVGYILFIAKIIVPLLLIILGTIDFAKATISSDDKAPKDAVISLIKRVLIAVIIFLIPTILDFLLSLVNGASEAFKDSEFTNCTDCLFDPFGDCEATDSFQ